ncbi:TetR/AcrR family transcriptional regulator [Rhodococcus sp. IEGM 1381]|uniref:TetR/AcrR family transcriptional regulator n=1 Tax=Rhodococcus sp. IEGM 1381 TaxID=3047085 RepID=UPI0024B74368|nr:TetR/AcrR family transcriptional regulator [Rhodococcus sp. IEGM 1381]MDI9894541.1 TetR/AcrR family transcriptional regulator [Rhodococcus sp. IEGM 1381]
MPESSVDRTASLRTIMDDLAVSFGVHKVALQRRSQDKLARVLDVARDLLEAGGPGAVTTTNVAAAAGISVGWLYHYFESREALLEEILVGCLRGLDNAMADAGMSLAGRKWKPNAEAGIKACLDYFGSDASFRAIWFSGEFSGRMLQVNRMHDDALAAWLAGTVTHTRAHAPEVSLHTVMSVFVGMLDKGVDLAFRDSMDHADAEVLAEIQRATVQYLATYLP